jgi:hypothetical protein
MIRLMEKSQYHSLILNLSALLSDVRSEYGWVDILVGMCYGAKPGSPIT